MPRARFWWSEPGYPVRRSERDTEQEREFGGVYPAVNIYDDGESFLIRAEVPGIDKERLEVTSKQTEVSIRGERTFKLAEPDAAFHRRERDQGVFHRIVSLPDPIDGSKIAASYKNGVLELICPRLEEAKSRKISIS